MASRLRFVVAYDGTPFAGWQSQTSGNTIQDYLERAFRVVTTEAIRVHGAGRTDAGVHALAQSAHADVPNRALDPAEWVGALNASLPPTIRVLKAAYTTDTFHSRFDAKGKVYRYRIWNDRILLPLEYGRAWHVPAPLDTAMMKREAAAFIGKHDFASFAANRGKPNEDAVRTIERVRFSQTGKFITLEFSGDGFLYRMVRLMVGALVRCGRGQAPEGEIRARLDEPATPRSAERLVAPACGLILVRVRY